MVYLVLEGFLTIWYTSTQVHKMGGSLFDESQSRAVLPIKEIGNAAISGGQELALWAKFATLCFLLTSCFFIVLKILFRFSVRKLAILVILFLTLSLFSFWILNRILHVIIGDYYAFTLIISTLSFFITKWVAAAGDGGYSGTAV